MVWCCLDVALRPEKPKRSVSHYVVSGYQKRATVGWQFTCEEARLNQQLTLSILIQLVV